jgi:serine/threonine-protein kinase HipA
MEQAFRTAYVFVRNSFAGTLQETDAGYVFAYDLQYLADPAAPG